MCACVSYKDLYAFLQVEPGVDDMVIRKAYRRAALQCHPDKPGGSAEAFRDVSLAFEVLSCPSARKLYDHRHYHQPMDAVGRTCYVKPNANAPVRVTVDHPMTTGSKRPLSHSSKVGARSTKRRSVSQSLRSREVTKATPTTASSLEPSPVTVHTFSHLQDVLRSMIAPAREAAIRDLPAPLRSALLSFMQKQGKTPRSCSPSRTPFRSKRSSCSRTEPRATAKSQPIERNNDQPCHRCRAPLSGFSGVRAIGAQQYKAYMDIKALRLYTCGHVTMEAAIENHIILVQLRHALQAASAGDPEIWERAEDIKRVCMDTMTSLETSEQKLGLRVFVSIRAEEWLDRDVHITSPVMSLSDALEVHSRVLRARRTSWELLRAEWVKLMRCKKRFLNTGLSLSEAEAFADSARQRALKKSLGQAVHRALRALRDEHRQKVKTLANQARQAASAKRQRRLDKATAIAKRRQARRQWWRQRDWTTEELLRGPQASKPL